MYSTTKIIRTISLIGACTLAATTTRAVDPPPDGGYPNANTAVGEDALFNLRIDGTSNTAVGFHALFGDTSGSVNTAIGSAALANNTTGEYNTATGAGALELNSTGDFNVAAGVDALHFNTTGNFNNAHGRNALYSNTTGSFNTAVGDVALAGNATGISNTAIGSSALFSLTNGNSNTAIGVEALSSSRSGSSNIAVGFGAGQNIKGGSYNIDIGNSGKRSDLDTIRIGTSSIQKNTFIAGISGVTVADGVAVIVGADGHLGTVTSSERFKEAIKPMDKASEAILALKPITFRYKKELDPDGIPQFGLVAEQVAKVDPDLVARDDQGKPYTVRYEAVNAMLLNEFLKEHRKGQEQDATITQLKSAVAQQQNQIKALTAALKAQAAQIQKVSDQLGAQAPAPRVVANN
jgi:hypothetical protein